MGSGHASAVRLPAHDLRCWDLRGFCLSVETPPRLSLRQIAGYFVRLGAFGFGGPIALAGYMQRDLVGRRHWFTQEEYLQGLAVSQTLPGPLAAQLPMWLRLPPPRLLGALRGARPFTP